MHQTTKHYTGQVTNYIPGDLLRLVLRDIFCETAWSCGNMHARDLDFDLSSFNGVPCSITWGCRGLLTFFGLFELAKERTPVTSRRSAECASVCSGSLTAEPLFWNCGFAYPRSPGSCSARLTVRGSLCGDWILICITMFWKLKHDSLAEWSKALA